MVRMADIVEAVGTSMLMGMLCFLILTGAMAVGCAMGDALGKAATALQSSAMVPMALVSWLDDSKCL